MSSVGIIGHGSFGALLTGLLAPHVSVKVYDHKSTPSKLPKNVEQAALADIAACPVVILAVDLQGMRSICEQLAPLVSKATIVMDVCSVKVLPARIMQELLGDSCRLLTSHPLFGPNSVAANGGTCKNLALVWHELTGGPFPELEALFGSVLGAKITRMTPDEHDQQMAWVHALTFFIGRGVLDLNIPDLQLDTGYYQKLRDLCELERTHSRALFDTIEAGNPYAFAVRRQFLETLQRLDDEIMEVTV